jgi:hypothetical protein
VAVIRASRILNRQERDEKELQIAFSFNDCQPPTLI